MCPFMFSIRHDQKVIHSTIFRLYFPELLKYKKAYLELVVGYGNTGCGVSKGGYKIRQILHKNQTQRKLLNFGLKASCQK